MHGYVSSPGVRLEVRCRRKDLPSVVDSPVESPEDWVILDPVEYADHVPRVGIDQFESSVGRWETQAEHHDGNTVGEHWESAHVKHRCRRKDLPATIDVIAVNPKGKTPMRLFVKPSSGEMEFSRECLGGNWIEIHCEGGFWIDKE